MANEWETPPDAVWVWGKYGKYEDTYCHAEEIKQEEFVVPVTKYIRADLATLSSDAARDALTELDQLRERVRELEKALIECEEYFDNRADADHDGIGFVANEEMNLQMMIRRVREGGKC